MREDTSEDMSEDTSNPTTPVPASLSHDPVSHLHWLTFDGKPDDQTRAALKAAGWRWGGYRKAWYSNRTVPQVPPCVEATDGGEVQYAAERPGRLEARAQKHDAKATAAYERSNAAVDMIPLGQPILRGHHSEGMHRAALKRARRAMDQSVREDAAARRLHHDAQSSRRHQAWVETPEAMTRRAERLEAEYRAMRRSIERIEQDMAAQGRSAELEASADHQGYRQYAENTRRTAELLREQITAAGGIRAGQLDPHVGDLVRIHGFTGVIVRINPKTYTVRLRHSGQDDWTLKIAHTWLTAIIRRANEPPQAEPQQDEPQEAEPQEAEPADPRPCVWCNRLTTDPRRVCQRCRDRDNGRQNDPFAS